MCDVTGTWEVWDVDYFVYKILNSVRLSPFNPSKIIIQDPMPMSDLIDLVGLKYYPSIIEYVTARNIILDGVSRACHEPDNASRAEVIRAAIQKVFDKYFISESEEEDGD